MDVGLTRRGDYGVRAALCLARSWHERSPRKIREVAEAMNLPRSYTPGILGMLAKAGLAEARAGRGGGYRLSRPPSNITLLEVVEAADGPLVPERCTLRGGPCGATPGCSVHQAWLRASDALRNALGTTSLQDLVEATPA